MNARTELVSRSIISRVAKSRELSLARMEEAVAALSAAYDLAEEAMKIAGAAHMGRRFYGLDRSSDRHLQRLSRDRFEADKSLAVFRQDLDASIWTYLLEEGGIKQLMDRQERERLERSLMADVPEATEENIRATLERLFADSDLIFKRGLANAFSKLDARFKSHDAFKIGSRMILEYAFDRDSGCTTYGGVWQTIADVERVFATLDGKRDWGGLEQRVANDRRGHWGPRQSRTDSSYFRIDGFKNGNAHLWFTRDDLVEKANLILADYYGAVLPDAYTEPEGEDLFRRSNVPAKDLQFYPTPQAVVEELLENLYLQAGQNCQILEPSAGDGAIALALARKGYRVRAIEIHPDRCAVLRDRAAREGLSHLITVEEANFLRVAPRRVYAAVVMNPPFYGTHYMDHVKHAFDFLAPGGKLRSVLPASAAVNESPKHEAFRAWARKFSDNGWRGLFHHLPPESFAESGTRINTAILTMRATR